MGKTVTRQELYNLVWSEPLTKLAATFGISSVALAKACDRMAVPVPPRGFWARKAVGKTDTRPTLPPRPPGLDEETMVGGGPYWRSHYWTRPSDEELFGPIPPEPNFEESLEAVRPRVEASIRRVIVPKVLELPHPAVARVLKYDAARAEKAREYGSSSSWYAPRYETPIQKRRLRLASTLFLALAQCGGRTELHGGEPYDGVANDFGVRVGDQLVTVQVAVIEAKATTGKGADRRTTTQDKIRITMAQGGGRTLDGQVWEDADKRLEDQLRDIAVAIVMRGEEQHRSAVMGRHKWRIEARAELIERRRKEREEAERKAIELQAKLEGERVERLLGEADGLRKAMAIRQYVVEAREANAKLSAPASDEEMAAWADWALAVADRIDPVVSGAFRKTGDTDG